MKKRLTLFFSLLALTECFSQNIGIGTSNPTLGKLQVNGVSGSGNTTAIFGSDGIGISFQRNWPTIGFNQYRDNTVGNGRYIANGFAAIQYLDPNTGYMYFDAFPNGTANTLTTGGTRILTIGANGNIGIKTNPANTPLYAVKAGNLSGAALFGGTYYNSYFCYGSQEDTYIRGGYPTSKVYLNDMSGNIVLGGGGTFVGINTSNPITTLDIHQTANKGLVIVHPNGFHTWEYRVVYFNGGPESDLRLYKDNVYSGIFTTTGFYSYVSSDKRVKTNIQPMPSVLEKMALLQPKIYEMKDFNENHQKTFGFIAQDIEQLYPEFVRVKHITVDSVNRIPDLYSMNYDGFDIIAIKALQEQYDQIKTLQKKNKELMDRLRSLEKKLSID